MDLMNYLSTGYIRCTSEDDAEEESEIPNFPFSRREHSLDPPEEYARLRYESPVSKVKLFDDTEAYLVTRSADIKATLSSPNLSALRAHPGHPEIHESGTTAIDAPAIFVDLDDPEHQAQRSLLEPCFARETIENMRPTIELIVGDVIDKMVEKRLNPPTESIDLVTHFANAVPTRIIYGMLGLGGSDIATPSKHSELLEGTSRDAAQMPGVSLKHHIANVVDQRIEAGNGKDLITYLVKNAYLKGRLRREELAEVVYTILIAGNAAMRNTIALGVLSLLQHPGQLKWLREDLDGRVHSASNEIPRYHTTSGLSCRRATKAAMRIGSVTIPANAGVICANQSGDRDRQAFIRPDEFNIMRKQIPSDSLAFGWGPHRCLAEWLSRAGLEIAISALFGRLKGIELAPDIDERRLSLSPAEQNLGLKELRVVW